MGSVVYFSAYTAIISLVLLNLFVAVVLEGFEGSNDTDEREVIAVCLKVWKMYDKNLTLEMDLMEVPLFVEHVQEELRKRSGDEIKKRGIGMKDTYFVLGLMDVETDEEGYGKVRFRQAVEAVIRMILAEGKSNLNEPEDFRDFAAELDDANKTVQKGESDTGTSLRAMMSRGSFLPSFKKWRCGECRPYSVPSALLLFSGAPANRPWKRTRGTEKPRTEKPEKPSGLRTMAF